MFRESRIGWTAPMAAGLMLFAAQFAPAQDHRPESRPVGRVGQLGELAAQEQAAFPEQAGRRRIDVLDVRRPGEEHDRGEERIGDRDEAVTGTDRSRGGSARHERRIECAAAIGP